MSRSQLVRPPDSVTGGAQYQQLGCIDAYDAVNNDDYAFVAFMETDSSGAWRVRITGKQTPGAVFEPDAMKSNACAAGAQGKPWFQCGFNIDPSASETRCVQFRVHVKDGKPHDIETFPQLRKAEGIADEPKAVRFGWPARSHQSVASNGGPAAHRGGEQIPLTRHVRHVRHPARADAQGRPT